MTNWQRSEQKERKWTQKKVNDSLYLVMEERIEGDKRNEEWHERKEQLKMERTRTKAKNGCQDSRES